MQEENGGESQNTIVRPLNMPKSCSFQTQIIEVACGEDHSCLITSAGHLYAMGSNAFGKLGITSTKNPNQEFYNTPKLVDSLVHNPIHKVSCGWNHTAGITKDG
jgi:alpha-tubulin suppressor-like RCC1 family protein